jgi:hypothetical protein
VKRFLIAAVVLASMGPCGGASASAQSMDDLNLQVHGYATQGFVYSTNNNWDTTNSTDGSSAWTEAVVNLTAQPESRLRIGVQARYYLLGNYGNTITLDWAQADFKVNEKLGFRVGKVKTPTGLLNESQDIDPAQLWILLPQSIYALASRNAILAHYGGVVYGAFPLGESFGKLEYRAYGGERKVASDDGSLAQFEVNGLQIPDGVSGAAFGGTLRWDTPLQGLMVGVTEGSENQSGTLTDNTLQGTIKTSPFNVPYFFGQYERKRIMFGGEYSRVPPHGAITLNGYPPFYTAEDRRSFYLMASYKLAQKLTSGLYYSSSIDRQAPISSARYQKDWAISSRYDFNPFLYLKLEQHFVDGTELGYNMSNNTGGLKPSTRMTLLKLGVSF